VTVIGLDDTDSRETGMCTTYAAHRLAERVTATGGTVERVVLVRLNPAVEYKTRGNAALAIHCDIDPAAVEPLLEDILDLAHDEDPLTNPGAVVAPGEPERVPAAVRDHARAAVCEQLAPESANTVLDGTDWTRQARGNGRGLVGAVAAAGAWAAFDDWTYECLSYRESAQWGTDRVVDTESVFAAAAEGYPAVWDTVDQNSGYPVAVPRTPCPILHGIRGDDPDAVEAVATAIDSEPVAARRTFVTNQGTDAHLRSAPLDAVDEGGAYRVDGRVTSEPETRPGGHVFFTISDGDRNGATDGDGALDSADTTLACAAFEPTKQFRESVRALRDGDRVTVCGEVSDGTLKLEKFAVRDLVTTERVPPTCPGCDRSMASAGADQGYRCRDCGTSHPSKTDQPLDRSLEAGWYEVPPVARRHIARPLVRGGFDAPTHPER
jgi:tRNA(Ile2)-agmatinylcytidine synthase